LRSGTRFRCNRVRRDPCSSFDLPNVFSAFLSGTGPVFKFYPPGPVFCVSQCVGSHFHVFRSGTRFWLNRVRRVPFSRFTYPDALSASPSAPGPVFTFCAPGRVFGVTESVGSHIHVLHSRTRFWLNRVRQVPFLSFALRGTFSALPSASGPVFTFCVPGRIFGVSEWVGSHFLVLRSVTRFRHNRVRRVRFSRLALRYVFSA